MSQEEPDRRLATRELGKIRAASTRLTAPEQWSATKVAYSLLSRHLLKVTDALPGKLVDQFTKFAEAVRVDDGYTEYPVSVKSEYRQDDIPAPAYLHSSISILLMAHL